MFIRRAISTHFILREDIMAAEKSEEKEHKEVRVSIEIGDKLKIQCEGMDVRLASKLVGKENGKYLIIKMPIVGNEVKLLRFLNTGATILVRCLHEGTIIGFQSKVISFIQKPEKLIFIEYPQKIESHELRGHKRIDCYLPANVRIADDLIKGCIRNISKKGCLCIIDTSDFEDKIKPLETGSDIYLDFPLPGMEKELAAKVKYRNAIRDDNGLGIGFESVDMDSEVETQLYNFLSSVGA